jgi:hypothetical protein
VSTTPCRVTPPLGARAPAYDGECYTPTLRLAMWHALADTRGLRLQRSVPNTHKIGIRSCEIFSSRMSRIIIDEPSCASAPKGVCCLLVLNSVTSTPQIDPHKSGRNELMMINVFYLENGRWQNPNASSKQCLLPHLYYSIL